MVLWTMLTRVLGGEQLAVVVVLADLVVLSLREAARALQTQQQQQQQQQQQGQWQQGQWQQQGRQDMLGL